MRELLSKIRGLFAVPRTSGPSKETATTLQSFPADGGPDDPLEALRPGMLALLKWRRIPKPDRAARDILDSLRKGLSRGEIAWEELGATAVRILNQRYGRPSFTGEGPDVPAISDHVSRLSNGELMVLHDRYIGRMEISDICRRHGISEEYFRRVRSKARAIWMYSKFQLHSPERESPTGSALSDSASF